MLLVSRWTIRRRVVEFVLQDVTGYSHISDEELDAKVGQIIKKNPKGVHNMLRVRGYGYLPPIWVVFWVQNSLNKGPLGRLYG